MMSYDILLLAAAALSTVLILFGVVIWGDFEDHHEHAKVNVSTRHHAG